ncbi:methyl-accepting chemotaxis protein [Vibrio fluvialis]|uniref:methyl-accepting chemotaxis protein n=2 Tax=Bacteria TaxID=2 RepID=UPI000CEB793D|nr:methyl-accepting chemotaxis protein [Vibrio fluvialis]AVH34665.1 methyl-accepting chemotaxis protein [Vibrio fluvialis]
MKIKYKLSIPILLIVITFGLVTASSIYQSKQQRKITQNLNQHMYPVAFSLDDAYRDLYQVMHAAQGVLLNQDQASIEYYSAEFDDNAYKAAPRMAKVATLIEQQLLPLSVQGDLDQLLSATHRWVQLYQPVFTHPYQANQYYAETHNQLDSEFKVIRKQLKTISNRLDDKKAQLQADFERSQQVAQRILEIGLVCALLSAMAAFAVAFRFVLQPIRNIEQAMVDIASGEGDLKQRLPEQSNDELGHVAKAFNQFVSQIHHTMQEVTKLSDALRREMQVIVHSADQVSAFSLAQQQENDLVAAAVHEMQATSQSVTDSACQAAQSSQEAHQDVSSAQQTASATATSINQLSEQMLCATETIHQLDMEVLNIASVLDVIRGIAEQTNLLALNAAIEAARAGEQGRGFAVVADEVRSLASRTQQSTGQIQQMIESLQSGASQAVKVMADSSAHREKAMEEVEQANASLQQISASIAHMNDMNTQIAASATQQTTVSSELNGSIQHMADNASHMVDMVHETKSSCATLNQQCTQLDRLVSRFKV